MDSYKNAKKDILFKGLTRPALLLGVPMIPLVMSSMVIVLIGNFTTYAFAILVLPNYFILRLLSANDEYIFNLFFLKLKTLTPNSLNKFFGTKTYISSEYRKMSKSFPLLSILGLDKVPCISKYLPYSSLISDSVVITHDYVLMSTWKIEGIPFKTEDLDFIEYNKNSLNSIFKSFANENVSFYFHNTRRDINVSINAKFTNKFAQEINEQYYNGFKNGDLKENSYYLTMMYNPLNTKIDKSAFTKLEGKKKLKELKIYLLRFNDLSDRLSSNLNSFRSSKLKIYNENGFDYSSQLEFYNYLIGGKYTKVRALNTPLNEYLNGGVKNVQFSQDMTQINFNDDTKLFSRIIEIKDYSDETCIGMLNCLMNLDINYTVTQSFQPMSKREGKEKLVKQEKQLIASEDDSLTQLEQFAIAQDELTSGNLVFGTYHFSLCVYGKTIDEVKDNSNVIINTLNEEGFLTTLSSIALPTTYFAQFPSNFALRPRVVSISSKNYSSLLALHNFPVGKFDKNCWGECISVLRTPIKTPYYLNLHQTIRKNDFGEFNLANTLILGQSGVGKTALMGFMCNQLLKFNDVNSFPSNIPQEKKKLTLIYLDKDKGALGNVLANGGRYLTVNNGTSTGFNPFMCEDTKRNRRKLSTLLKILVTTNNQSISTSEEKQLDNAINFIFETFTRNERKFGISLLLENLTDDFTNDNSLKQRLELWKKGKKFGWVFDNENDLLDFPDDINFFGIDGTQFLDDEEVSAPISFYILWRVTNLIDGRRIGILIDEFWKWVENPYIQDDVKNQEKTIRKRNGFILPATQSVEDFLKLDIASAIIEQSSTLIFLPNNKAKENEYVKGLSCTYEEFKTIKNFDVTDRPFLIKKDNEVSIINFDLSSLAKEDISILSTGEVHIEKIESIFAQDITLDEKVEELREYYRSCD